MPKEKYQASRDDGKKSKEPDESSKKVVSSAAKLLGEEVAPGVGGAVVGKALDTKLGQAYLNKAGKALEKQNPGIAKIAKNLDDKGVLDKADKGLSAMSNSPNSGSGAGANKNALGMGNTDKKALGMGDTSEKTPGGSKLGDISDLLGDKEKTNKGKLDSYSDSDIDSELEFNTDSTTTVIEGFKKLIMLGGPAGTVFFAVICIVFFATIVISITISATEKNGSGKLAKDTSSNSNDSISGGQCSYSIKGISNGTRKYNKSYEVSNLKVRLMECDGSGPVSGEDLIDFEDYIVGVVYAENPGGTKESYKVQAVAARSYALSRSTIMGNAGGTKLEEENGNWVLQIRACTSDQVYCNPDKGCWGNNSQGGATVHSGEDKSKPLSRPPIPEGSKLRKAISEAVEATAGEIVVDSNGYLITCDYVNTDQTMWNTKAKKGFDYKQIILEHYNTHRKLGASEIIKASCTSNDDNGGSTGGDYVNWKQGDPAWGNIRIGNSSQTLRSAGCLVTSISILIAKSGVSTNISGEFNPGTFLQKLNEIHNFSGASLSDWQRIEEVAPDFKYVGRTNLAGSTRQEKYNTIKELLDKGYFIAAEVKGNTGQHWVAIDKASGNDNFVMIDPGTQATILWDKYDWRNTSTLGYYKAK